MKIKVDENLLVSVADDLRAMGHDANTVDDEQLSGAADPTVIARATVAGRALLTLSKGLADVRAYPPSQYAGVILLRPKTTGRGAVVWFARDQPAEPAGHQPAWPADGHLRGGDPAAVRKMAGSM